MAWANNKQPKHSTARSFNFDLQSVPASIMKPRLMVLLSAAFLTVVGLVMVFSTTTVTSLSNSGSGIPDVVKQVIVIAIGVAAAFFIVKVFSDDERLRWGSRVFWAVCFVLFVLTFAAGTEVYGARRWLGIGGFTIQPSELMKIAIVLVAADMGVGYREGRYDFKDIVIKVAIYIALPLVFIIGPNSFRLQSDLGSTMIIFVALLMVMYLSGASNKTMIAIILAVVFVGIAAIATQPYRMERLTAFNPWESADNESYQLIRSLKALAAGGIFGKGVGASYETYLTFSESDFIFAIVGEEVGFFGATLVIIAFFVLLIGGFRIATNARSDYHMIIAGALTLMLFFQACLSIASVIGAGPTTGKPLPFMSAGGSSMLSSMMIVGLLMLVSVSSDTSDHHNKRRENLQVVSSDSLNSDAYYEAPRSSYGGVPSAAHRSNGSLHLVNPNQNYSHSGGRSAHSGRSSQGGLDYSSPRNSRYR